MAEILGLVVPVDDERLKFLLVGVPVVRTEQEFATIQLNPDVGLGSTNVASVVSDQLLNFSNVFHLKVSKH